MTEAQPTFSWAGIGRPEGSRVYYDSFNFSGELYSLGDCVYLLPEEEGASPYIAKLVRAFEDTAAADAEKLIIEVQWFERRGSVPPSLGAVMSEAEVVESDLRDTNLVGCIDRKAVVVRASSYAQACELLPVAKRKGEWHFCRGLFQSATQTFKTYEQLGQHTYGEVVGIIQQQHQHLQQQQQQQFTMYPLNNGYSNSHALHLGDSEMPDVVPAVAPAPPPSAVTSSSHRHSNAANAGGPAASSAANSRSRRAAAAARVAAAAAAAGGGSGSVRGVPGKVCCECGATQTPQWREGPLGPKTLCNACGVRYQRSQSKAKSNKRVSADRKHNDRGSPQHGRAPKQQCLSRLSANTTAAAGMSPTAATAEAAAANGGFTQGLDLSGCHSHGTRSNASKANGKQHRSAQQRNGLYLGGDVHMNGHYHQQQQLDAGLRQQQQPRVLSHGDGLHYYQDEGSPPNMHTHILVEAEDDDAMRQQLPLRETLNRSATHEAAEALHSLSAHQPQQQQSVAAAVAHHAVSAAFCSSVIGSPSSNMLLSDQLQAADMPLLSLDDKDPVLPGLGGPDSLDAALTSRGLSPIQPRPQRIAVASTAVHGTNTGKPGTATTTVCASPGRLIAQMVQGLKLPAPLSLNSASMSHHSTATVVPQPVPSLLPSMAAAAPATSAPTAAGNVHSWTSVNNHAGVMMPINGSSSNMTPSSGTTPTAAAAAAAAAANKAISGVPGSAESQMTSIAISSCDAGLGCNGLTPNSLSATPTGFAAAAHCQLQQHGGSNSCLLSQLRSLVFRASSYAPDVQGLSGLYPGPSSPRALNYLATSLEQLPQTARVQLQQVSAILEDNLSKAKAAEAAVVAVTQVLAAKKQAAADARQDVENSIMQFRQMLGQVSPQVAAAAAGNGSGSAYCSPVPTPVAGAGPGRCCMTTVSSGCLAAAAAVDDCLVGSSRLGGNSPRVLVQPQQQQDLLSHPTQGFDLSTDNYGSKAAAAAGENLGQGEAEDHSDADDLIRDPEEGTAAGAATEVGVRVLTAAVDKVQQQQQEEVDKQEDQQQAQQQECSAGGDCCKPQIMATVVMFEQQAPAVTIQRQPAEPTSTSGSSDGPAGAAPSQQQQQQHGHQPAVNSQQRDGAVLVEGLFAAAVQAPAAEAAGSPPPSPPPTSAAYPAAETAPVAA